MLSRSAWARTAKPPRGETSNKKTSTKRCSFFLVHFQGLSRLRRVAAIRAPRGPPAALRRCPALRLAASATGGARLLSRLRRVAAVRAPRGPPAVLRRCPALRLAASATGGARLRAPSARISGPMESGSRGSKTNEKGPPVWVVLFVWCTSRDSNPGPAD